MTDLIDTEFYAWAVKERRDVTVKGGEGSGNFNHEGRPGEIGGSGGGGGSGGANDRAAKIDQLKKDNAGILATPLMSEGSISPMQVGMMSDRQKKTWQENAQKRMEIESQIRDLQKSDSQLSSEQHAADRRQASGRVLQLTNRVEDLSRLGIGKSGKLRPTYQKEVDKANAELEEIYSKHPDLKQ